MKNVSRNVFQTVIQKIKKGAVDVELSLYCPTGAVIHAVVTNEAANELELESGKKVLALIKAYAITVSAPNKANSMDGNHVLGTVSRVTKTKDNCEIVLDIGDSKSLTAVIPREKLDKLLINRGARLLAHFKPEDVILAAN